MDILLGIIAVVALAFMWPILKVITDATGNTLTEQGFTADDGNYLAPSNTVGYWNMADNMTVVVLLGVIFASGYYAYQNPTAPLLIVFFLFFMVLLIYISVVWSNAYESFSNSTTNITDATGAMPKTQNVMAKLPVYTLIGTVLIGIVYYSRWS